MSELTYRATTAKDYLALARLDHVTKHVFVLPGIALAWALRGIRTETLWLDLIAGFLCVIAIASANYVINEFLDREFDRHHPTKSGRASVVTDIDARIVSLMWILLVAIGLGAAALSSTTMLAVAALFALQGIVYNVPPIRLKDKPYLDVLSESINNPFRLLIGWAIVDPTSLAPASIIVAYWLAGAFLMTAKRYSEYREIVGQHGRTLLVRYRRSFEGYSEVKLAGASFAYALLSTAAFAVFLVKYRIEYVLLLPPLACLFALYFALAVRPRSVAQAPERLFREPRLMLWVAIFGVATLVLSMVNLPWLEPLTSQRFLALPW